MGTARFNLFESLTTARRLFLDRFNCGCPNEGLWILIPRRQKFHNCILQIFYAAEGAPPHSLGCQFSKAALDQIEPSGTGRHKVRDEARMPFDPGLHSGMLVSAIVVHHQMQGHLAGKLLLQTAHHNEQQHSDNAQRQAVCQRGLESQKGPDSLSSDDDLQLGRILAHVIS